MTETISTDTMNRIAVTAAIALAAFLLGFGTMWVTSSGDERESDSLARALRPSVLQNSLATAALNAQRGEFEQARQQASSFFTDLRAELDGEDSAFAADREEPVESILARRDETITLLARGDPAGARQLSEMYFNFLKAKNSADPIKK